MWFFSNYENMKLLATAYDRCYEYFLPNSMYELAVTTGWPDSQMMGNLNSQDPGQFSNEVLKPREQRVKNLMKYPKWQCINNHILYKWFFIDSGLYKKSRFV